MSFAAYLVAHAAYAGFGTDVSTTSPVWLRGTTISVKCVVLVDENTSVVPVPHRL